MLLEISYEGSMFVRASTRPQARSIPEKESFKSRRQRTYIYTYFMPKEKTCQMRVGSVTR